MVRLEKVLKGYTFRLYPNEEQKTLIEKSFGCSRYIYNYFLDKTNGRKYIKKFDYIKDIPILSKEKELNYIEDVWKLKRINLKNLGFNNDEIKEIVISLQLIGLDLNKKKY